MGWTSNPTHHPNLPAVMQSSASRNSMQTSRTLAMPIYPATPTDTAAWTLGVVMLTSAAGIDFTSSVKARTSQVPGIPTILGQHGLHSQEIFSLQPSAATNISSYSSCWCRALTPGLQQVHVQQDPNHRSNSPCESCQHALGRRLHLLHGLGNKAPIPRLVACIPAYRPCLNAEFCGPA